MIGWSGRLRSWLWIVVKPLTSSPAMPIDHLGRPEAGHLLGLLERDRAVVDDGRDVGDRARLHVAEALALAADAADRAVAVSSISKTSALANSVPTSSAVQAASASLAVALPGSGARTSFSSPRAVAESRGRPRASASPSPSPSAALALGHLRPPAAPAVDRGDRRPDQLAGRDARAPTRSSLTVTKTCGSSASSPSAMTPDAEHAADVLGGALQRVDRLERAGERDQAHARRDLLGPGRELGRRRQARSPPPALSRRLRLAQLVLERGDPVGDGLDDLRAERARRSARASRPGRRPAAVGAGAGQRLDAAHADPMRARR